MMRALTAIIAAVAAVWLALSPVPALAWGSYGHRTTAEIAMANVKPETAARIRALLAVQKQLGTPKCPVHSLADAATWPDCLRGDAWRWAYTFPWHYQTENVCKPFDPKSDCANGNCVSAQIERNLRLLSDRTLPSAQRLEALAFLVHFIGDIHMPLHSGDAADAGGNAVKGSYGIAPGTNLHSIWDGALAERAISSAVPPLVRRYPAEERARLSGGTVADWGRESWTLAKTIIYPRLMKDGDPCLAGASKATALAWSEADIEAGIPIVRERIVEAGLRMARLLDEALSGPPRAAQAGRPGES
ncbi:S1/P1 nuclease [Parablastomonas sp. CN1-191]|uniref:S1/P1 nuclease n=1 Tax=Parablastomonas sp. CN1-191 TaxID=3400908 RepID=UPI003BF7DE2C